MGKKDKKKKPEAGGPPGAPEWVVTFTDMISLLVTFFVLMMTFSSMDTYEALKVDSFLTGGSGIREYNGFVASAPEHDQVSATHLTRGARQAHARPPQELPENLEEMGQKADDEHLGLNFAAFPDGLVIEFDEADAFGPGETRVNDHFRKSLAEIGEVLGHYPFLIVVEGFTDDAFRPTPKYPTPEALSFARAESAAQALLRESRVLHELVQVAGRGMAEPRSEGDSATNRVLDRRVQLRVLSLSRALTQHYESQLERRGR